MALAATVDTSERSAEPHIAAPVDGGGTVIVSYRGDGQGGAPHDETLESIATSSGEATTISVTTNTEATSNQAPYLAFGPDGRLYYGRNNDTVGLSIFAADGTGEIEQLAEGNATKVIFAPGGDGYYVRTAGEDGTFLVRRSMADAELEFPSGATEIEVGAFSHVGLCTPF
jgi:hypothetical protein